jgi:hypothetical protein
MKLKVMIQGERMPYIQEVKDAHEAVMRWAEYMRVGIFIPEDAKFVSPWQIKGASLEDNQRQDNH